MRAAGTITTTAEAASLWIEPQNPAPTPTQKPDSAACDKKLAGLFGGEGAVADTGRTPSTLQHPTAGMQRFPDHSAEGGVMHLHQYPGHSAT
jgi:hypothetical protein